MGTTHSMDGRYTGCGWLNGDTHMDDRGKGYVPISLSWMEDTRDVAGWMVTHTWMTEARGMYPSLCHGWKIQGMWLVEWWHTHGWQRQGVCTHLSVMDGRYKGCGWLNGDTHMDDRGKGYVPISLSWMEDTRDVAGCMVTHTWMTEARGMYPSLCHGWKIQGMWLVEWWHTHGWQRQGVCTHLSVMDGRYKGCGWLNGDTHMDDRGKGYVPISLSWMEDTRDVAGCMVTHTWMTEARGMYPSLCHGWKIQGMWLVEWWHTHGWQRQGVCTHLSVINGRYKGCGWLNGDTHMDDRGKGYVPISLSCTYATPNQPAAPFTLASMFLVCDPHSTRGGVRQDETMGTTGKWEHKHMDDKV